MTFSPESAPNENAGKGGVLNKLTAQGILEAIEKGEAVEVKVRRSSGEIEGGWQVIGIEGGNVVVAKKDKGVGKTKYIPIESLREANKET
ncbi:hypothetical protein HYV30_04460 [Candidatus Kaiserbacteria bacterium]|nr:hypothetical protein [Candidatus Kaiserbacteria bacterium]